MSNLNDVRFTFSTPADEAIQFDVVSFELTEGVSQRSPKGWAISHIAPDSFSRRGTDKRSSA